ncbi:MAG: family 1 encapsulin nanocompartment shell protein [Alphaproteobacteria bacterium]
MDDLHRSLAPITAAGWDEIDEEAKATLRRTLAARRLVDFAGPLGWSTSAVNLGRTKALRGNPADGVMAAQRVVQPLVEFRVPFELKRSELDALARGAKDPDLDPVRKAALAIAVAEDRSVFHGYADGGIEGIFAAADVGPLTISEDFQKYPVLVAEATGALRDAGVEGPYAIALGPRCYTGLTKTSTPAGYPIIKHVERLLDGPVVWSPGIDGAVVMSLRGGDFELSVGRDLSIGYLDHSGSAVQLYIEESLTFRVLGPEAAVPLAYEDSASSKTRKSKSK